MAVDTSLNPTPRYRIISGDDHQGVHCDDIHGLIRVKDASAGDTIISGSKDGTLKQWTLEGKLINKIFTSTRDNQERWVTALCADSFAESWMAGFRYGSLRFYIQDRAVEERPYEARVTYSPTNLTDQRNQNRIWSLASFKNSFFSGTANSLCEWRRRDRDFSVQSEADTGNQRVYCINPLTETKLAVVTGSVLDVWEKEERLLQQNWRKKEELCNQTSSSLRIQTMVTVRDSLSADFQGSRLAIGFVKKYTDGDEEEDGYSCRGKGSLITMDVNTKEIVSRYDEHTGGVWSVINLSPHILATGSDDRTVKIWDLRQAESVYTFEDGFNGRVSALLALRDNFFVAGSCPSEYTASDEKGRLTFWDLRRV